MKKRTLSSGVVLALALAGCGDGDGGGDEAANEQPRSEAAIVTPANLGELTLGKPLQIAGSAATNPTAAHDPDRGAVYMAWTQEVPGQTVAAGDDPRLQAVVARSDDEGATFGAPVTVSDPAHDVYTRTVSPTQVKVGPEGAVYVLYQYAVESELSEHRGLRHMLVTRSDDGGQTWGRSALVAKATCVCCGTVVARGADGPVYASTAFEGTIPSISAGNGSATVVWQGVPASAAEEEALTSVHAAVVQAG